ncbi:MAG TPA: hypothetical protein VGR31_03085 [Planctomycetota bacterium]|nr:hypothetical protein [Planctomycetota bacterium]
MHERFERAARPHAAGSAQFGPTWAEVRSARVRASPRIAARVAGVSPAAVPEQPPAIDMKAKSLSILCAFILLGGCRSTPPSDTELADQLTLGKVQGEIKVGLSSARVVEVLGSPNIITTDEQRREVWVYDKISTEHMNAGTSSYGTLLLFGGQSHESRSSSRQRRRVFVASTDKDMRITFDGKEGEPALSFDVLRNGLVSTGKRME